MNLQKINTSLKILTVVGARPQFIKCANLSKHINEHRSSEINEIIVHTGQHYDENMSKLLFMELKIPHPKFNLGINKVDQGAMVGRMIEGLEKICLSENPDWVLVYGDTNSTLAAAIVASKLKIKLAHVESGLRSYNMCMPEEVNRVLTDRVSTLLFCPTKNAVKNLVKEGFENFSNVNIINVGDIMYDAALNFSDMSKQPILSFNAKNVEYILVTLHRTEITSNKNKLLSVLSALNKISESTKVVAPFHPRTTKAIEKFQISVDFDIISPVSYLEMLWLIQNSKLVITDSGGLQKEAFFFKKISLIAREETEWVELLQSSNSKLVGYDKNKILSEYYNSKDFKSCPKLFGDGKTAELIINSIINYSKT